MKPLITYLILFVSCVGFAQQVTHDVKSTKTFSLKDGYNISDVTHLKFDEADWLWIVGFSSHTGSYQLQSSNHIIQRYDGQSFFDYQLPIQKEAKGRLDFIAIDKNRFFFKFYNDDINLLYQVNPLTLESKPIAGYKDIVGNSDKVQMFSYKDGLLFFVNRGLETILYKMDQDLEFTQLNSIHNGDETSLHFSKLHDLGEYFIVNEERLGLHVFNSDGTIFRINGQDTDHFAKEGKKLSYRDYVVIEGVPYYFTDESTVAYIYKDGSIKKSDSSMKWMLPSKNVRLVAQDGLGNTGFVVDNKDRFALGVFNQKKNTLDELDFTFLKLPVITSRDFSKELIVANGGNLIHYFFSNAQINTYLEDYSIRTIFEKAPNSFIVATAQHGWFNVNTERDVVSKMNLTLPDPPAPFNENRAIFSAKDGYFSNNRNGIIHIDTLHGNTTSYVYYPIEGMTEDEDYIYYGTLVHQLVKFDKQKRENIPLLITDTLDLHGIVLQDETLYVASDKGLLIYSNNQSKILKPSIAKKEDNSLICVLHDEEYGIIVGSRSGRVYQFVPENSSFKELYEDPYGASIATILIDDVGSLWLNTFAGIVQYNPMTKESVRYLEKDGLSYFECNRYSATRASDGRFLVGTLKGLNVFEPQNLKQTNWVGQPRITSITTFDNKLDQWIENSAPNVVESIQHITLSPTHRSVSLIVGMTDILNYEFIDLEYSLSKNNEPSSWAALTNKNQITLSNLSDGEYKLSIRATSKLEEVIGEPIHLTITAQPFFYETSWFPFLVIALLLVAFYYFWRQAAERQRIQKQLTQNLIIGQEEERSRLSRELHDGIGQQMILLIRSAQNENQKEISDMASNALEGLREITRNLHPSLLEKVGVTEAVSHLVNQIDAQTSIFFTLEIDSIDDILSKEKQLVLYRFIQECLNNIVKHANAKAVDVIVQRQERMIGVKITDNGQGFLVKDKLKSKDSIGLQTLHERVRMMNGILQIKSELDKGTVVKADIPLDIKDEYNES